MYTRYYDGYTRRNNIAVTDTAPIETNEEQNEIASAEEPEVQIASALPFGLPMGLKTDDIILIAVLFLVASESGDDFILPLILGYLLLSNM